MNEQQEALKLALEAFESGVKTTANRISWTEYDSCLIAEAITAIKEALAQPAQRPWVGLTDEEIVKIISSNTSTGLWQMAIQIESALKSKNT